MKELLQTLIGRYTGWRYKMDYRGIQRWTYGIKYHYVFNHLELGTAIYIRGDKILDSKYINYKIMARKMAFEEGE